MALRPARPAIAIEAAASALRDGAIVAVKGIGGFHLACRADDEARRRRFASAQAPRGQAVRAHGPVARRGRCARGRSARERELLLGPERPIVLAPRRPDAAVAGLGRAGLAELGVMLPIRRCTICCSPTPARTLVMTSGNVSDEPIAYRDDFPLASAADTR